MKTIIITGAAHGVGHEIAKILKGNKLLLIDEDKKSLEKEEIFDVFDINGNYLGTKPKSFCHSKECNCYHKPVWIWIINSKNEILVQKRAATKKHHPSEWDTPSAGHVGTGEDFVEACQRETKEKLGVYFEKERFIFQREFLSQKAWEFGQVYLLKADIKLKDFKLQKEEVSEVKWLNLENFKKLLYSNEFVPYDKEYKDWVVNMIQQNFERSKG